MREGNCGSREIMFVQKHFFLLLKIVNFGFDVFVECNNSSDNPVSIAFSMDSRLYLLHLFYC